MIVFDGSGSMWGKFDGDKRPKFEIARDGLKSILPEVPPTVSYGLYSFGHRRSGDCSDIQMLVAPAPADPQRVLAPLDKLNPRGKGPIAAALREAANALPSTTAGSIVLIHDNVDNCRQDPCEAAKEIHAASPKLKIHLVAIGLEPGDLGRMRCIAETTGGTVHEASDAAELQQSVIDAVRVAMIAKTPSPSTADVARADPGAKEPEQAPLPAMPGIALSARLGRDGPAIEAPVRWTVLRGTTIVFEATGPSVFASLEPGPYSVEAVAGLAKAKAKADVAGPGAIRLAVAFDAGTLRVAVKDLKDGPVSATAMLSLRKADESAADSRPLWIGRAVDANLLVPAGAYRITVADGLIARDETLMVTAGASVVRDIVSGGGRLEVSITSPDGQPVDGVTILLARDDPEAKGGRREIARSAAAKPVFILPAGTYYITARSGAASIRERVAVGAGDTVKQAVAFGLARLSVVPSGWTAQGSTRTMIETRILSLDGPPQEIARSLEPAPEFTLKPGRYRIALSAGRHNAHASQDVELEPLARRKVNLKLEARTVLLRLAGAGTADVAWEVRDATGALVARTLDPAPDLVLGPGRYRVTAELREATATGSFEVAGGGEAAQTVELRAK